MVDIERRTHEIGFTEDNLGLQSVDLIKLFRDLWDCFETECEEVALTTAFVTACTQGRSK